MPRRLDIGIASYGSPELLRQTIASVQAMSTTDWRLIIADNPHPASGYAYDPSGDPRVLYAPLKENVGYAGAVNEILRHAETEYIAYLDNDVVIQTPGWDETLCSYLDRFHEIGMVFPNGGAYPISRPGYQEIQWGVGFSWLLSRYAMSETGLFDAEIGHQNECDYCLRLRMAGWRCAAAPEVVVNHLATATNDPAAIERIGKGVQEFVNKWCKYFGGKNLNYFSPNVLRWEDWPPNALYLEEYWRLRVPGLNAEPGAIVLDGKEYDLIQVPRLKGFYGNRII